MPSVIIVSGFHCRLDRICPDRTWKEDEAILLADGMHVRNKGDKVPSDLMRTWTHERHLHPHLFDPSKVRVWQQPRAVQNEVTIRWFTELIMEFFPQSSVADR